MTDIVLNIKEIAIKMDGDDAKRMVVRKQGPGVVTAGDIQTVGDIEILNPNHVICTLDEGAEIRMEFTVNNGKGYVPADRNRSKMRRSASFRSTACTLRSRRSPTRWKTPVKARFSTMTS